VYPALAVAEELKRLVPQANLLFIGGDRLERKVVPAAGLPFRTISVHGLAGRGLSAWARRVRSAAELLIGLPLWQSLLILRRFRPQAVIGTGGYVSGPVILAARMMRIPCLAVEGNRTPGLTSRIVSRMVQVMAVAWPDLAPFFAARMRRDARVVVTGMPVRSALLELTREQGAAALGFDPARPILLVLGGSLGSQRINKAVTGALRVLENAEANTRDLQVLHMVGPERLPGASQEEMQALVPGYRAVRYLDQDYPHAIAAADLVVARAGASTVAEIIARHLPSVLVPWAAASTGEQMRNAEPLARSGAAAVIPDSELTPQRLAQTLSEILWDPERRERMSQAAGLLGHADAAARVAELALGLARGD
jgi:UDP-N-acetylglucosamine--N-acetylmuramyl-(pentapeptide) pyrophosphoryl-undecaprenol N-acetylglucosamine transferase